MAIRDRYIPTGRDFRVYIGAADQDLSLITTVASIQTAITAGTLEDISKRLMSKDFSPVSETAGADFGQSQWRFKQGVIGALSGSMEVYSNDANDKYFTSLFFKTNALNGETREYRPVWITDLPPASGVACWRGYLLVETIPSSVRTASLKTFNLTAHINVDEDVNPYFIFA